MHCDITLLESYLAASASVYIQAHGKAGLLTVCTRENMCPPRDTYQHWALTVFGCDPQNCLIFQDVFNWVHILLHFRLEVACEEVLGKKEKPAEVWKLTKDWLHI